MVWRSNSQRAVITTPNHTQLSSLTLPERFHSTSEKDNLPFSSHAGFERPSSRHYSLMNQCCWYTALYPRSCYHMIIIRLSDCGLSGLRKIRTSGKPKLQRMRSQTGDVCSFNTVFFMGLLLVWTELRMRAERRDAEEEAAHGKYKHKLQNVKWKR